MSKSVPVTITNMCMVYDGDRMVVQNRKNPNWAGITFPGGHVEDGESMVEAVVREVLEETGLAIENPILCGIKDWQNQDGSRYMVLLFKTNRYSGELISSDEGEVMWVSREALCELPLADGFAELFTVFEGDDRSEFFYRIDGDVWNVEIR